MVLPANGVQISDELCDELRNKFINELCESADSYDEDDIDRVKNDDAYCKRFLRHKRLNVEQAFIMLKEALAWRKSFNVKNISVDTIPEEFFSAKAVFPYNHDKDGNSIVMLLVRFHRKGSEYALDLRRFLVFWVEEMEKVTVSGKLTVVMNCIDAGISHLDLDLIQFLITLFKSYYPDLLAYILIYEMPWIFNTAWKVIKSWLPEDTVDKIKFVNKTSVLDYIDKECLSVEMGGTDTHEYEPPVKNNELHDNSEELSNDGMKRVHFSVNKSQSSETLCETLNSFSVQANASPTKPGHVLVTDDFTLIGGILRISPASVLVFFSTEASRATVDVKIKLTCVSDKRIAYKVKTNNIASYRVKPSSGILKSGNSVDITVFVVQGYSPRPADKFLIMATEIDDSSVESSLNFLWRSRSSEQIVEHKLKCVIEDAEKQDAEAEIDNTLQNIHSELRNINTKLASVEARQVSIQSRQNFLIFSLFLLLGLTFSLVINAYFDFFKKLL